MLSADILTVRRHEIAQADLPVAAADVYRDRKGTQIREQLPPRAQETFFPDKLEKIQSVSSEGLAGSRVRACALRSLLTS